MLLLLHVIVTYIKENIITKLQELYISPRNPRVGNKLLALFLKKPLCTGNLLKYSLKDPRVISRISRNKSNQKSGFTLILCLFLDDTLSKIERDGTLFRKRCQNFTSRILSHWLNEDITCSSLRINKKQKATDKDTENRTVEC